MKRFLVWQFFLELEKLKLSAKAVKIASNSKVLTKVDDGLKIVKKCVGEIGAKLFKKEEKKIASEVTEEIAEKTIKEASEHVDDVIKDGIRTGSC